MTTDSDCGSKSNCGLQLITRAPCAARPQAGKPMATLAHSLSQLLPRPLATWLAPKWHLARETYLLRQRQGGRLWYDRELLCWIARKPLPGGAAIEVPVRSYRELRRVVNFDANREDLVLIWLTAIDDCTMLYDIGSANGLEGFAANALHGCRVVFVEPFTPSVESILKGVVLATRRGQSVERFDVFQAGCDRAMGLSRVLLHNPPVPGGTYNTFADVDAYCRGGRGGERVWATQWAPAVSIDGLHASCGLPRPSHVKIDVDGFEDRVIAGATETLASRAVRSWIVEISPGRLEPIQAAMIGAGYQEIASFEHYPGLDDCWDRLYVRDDLVDDYRHRLETARLRRP
ncbi:MAG: FkbM family methyltransferase [Alphaproteobacteria bacterium]|nr:FkbM family methyltransferase [Alphaproteobacteria bacterium]